MIDRLRLLRNALERMIIDDDWPPFLADLRRRSARAHEVGVHVPATICSDGFWHSCEIFLYMVIPVVKALHVFDGKAPVMDLLGRSCMTYIPIFNPLHNPRSTWNLILLNKL
jgi:hypothetical protein